MIILYTISLLISIPIWMEARMVDIQNLLEIYLETCNRQTEFDYIFSVSLGKLPIHLGKIQP